MMDRKWRMMCVKEQEVKDDGQEVKDDGQEVKDD